MMPAAPAAFASRLSSITTSVEIVPVPAITGTLPAATSTAMEEPCTLLGCHRQDSPVQPDTTSRCRPFALIEREIVAERLLVDRPVGRERRHGCNQASFPIHFPIVHRNLHQPTGRLATSVTNRCAASSRHSTCGLPNVLGRDAAGERR